MNELIRAIAPGVAVAGAALGTVVLFDPGLRGDPPSVVAPVEGTGPAAQQPSEADGTDDSGSVAQSPATGSGSASSADGASCTGQSITGDAADTPWGPVRVRLQLASDGSLCSVQAIAYPSGDHHSARINAQAVPYLNEAATSQGVEFDSVTGATYTSEAYRASLQSALDLR